MQSLESSFTDVTDADQINQTSAPRVSTNPIYHIAESVDSRTHKVAPSLSRSDSGVYVRGPDGVEAKAPETTCKPSCRPDGYRRYPERRKSPLLQSIQFDEISDSEDANVPVGAGLAGRRNSRHETPIPGIWGNIPRLQTVDLNFGHRDIRTVVTVPNRHESSQAEQVNLIQELNAIIRATPTRVLRDIWSKQCHVTEHDPSSRVSVSKTTEQHRHLLKQALPHSGYKQIKSVEPHAPALWMTLREQVDGLKSIVRAMPKNAINKIWDDRVEHRSLLTKLSMPEPRSIHSPHGGELSQWSILLDPDLGFVGTVEHADEASSLLESAMRGAGTIRH